MSVILYVQGSVFLCVLGRQCSRYCTVIGLNISVCLSAYVDGCNISAYNTCQKVSNCSTCFVPLTHYHSIQFPFNSIVALCFLHFMHPPTKTSGKSKAAIPTQLLDAS